MSYRKFKLFLDLLEKYMDMQGVYGYEIVNATTYTNGIIFSISEITPSGSKENPYLLITEIKDGVLSFKNESLDNCIYDYLEEMDINKEEADSFMKECYQIIADAV